MQLTMTILRCPDAVTPETRTVTGGEYSVGRGPGVDWVLPDNERALSKRHFAVAFRGGSWQIADTSTNGTYVNREGAPIGSGTVRNLRDGDRLRAGAYEIEVRLVEQAAAPANPPRGQFGAFDGRRGSEANVFGDPFGMDPFAEPSPPQNPFGDPAYRRPLEAPSAVQLPHDFDPLAPEPLDAPFRGPTQADHSPVMEDAFRPPASIGQMPLHSGGVIPGDDLLPDDWDKDLLEGIVPAGRPQPAQERAVPPIIQPPAAPLVAQPNAAPPPPPIAPPAAQPPPLVPPTAQPPPLVPPTAQPPPLTPPTAQLPAAAAPLPAAVASSDLALLDAFLEGVGIDARPSDPAAMMLALGKAFRTLVSGLRSVLIARAAIKGEFRIEQTVIRARGNNPLKFSAGEDDALAALLGTGRRTDMAPHEAVADALRDIRLHELASMSAMQAAVRAIMDGLAPAKLRAAAEQGSGMTLLPVQKKARAWDTYEALHAHTVQALADDFDSAFGKAFARAYERALNEISAKE